MVKFKIPTHNYTERELSVINILNDNRHLNIKSFLNVGFHGWNDIRAHWWIKVCDENGIDWKILEIFEKNIQNAILDGCPHDNIILGDILNTGDYNNVDCLMFWHGPEHIDKNLFLSKLGDIEKKVNKLIIFGMPLGYEPQDEVYGNKFETHISEWQPEDWNRLGYHAIVVKDRLKYQHITSFKILSNE